MTKGRGGKVEGGYECILIAPKSIHISIYRCCAISIESIQIFFHIFAFLQSIIFVLSIVFRYSCIDIFFSVLQSEKKGEKKIKKKL